MHWAQLEHDLSQFQEWIQIKERTLREMESNPEASQEEMMQQAANIQV